MYPILLVITGAILIPGFIARTRSVSAGRKGPGMFQHLYNVRLLLRKGNVISSTSGAVQQVAPSVVLASVLLSALFIPFAGKPGILSFSYDFVFFACILGLSRFWMIIAALDAGSSFEGMGASREALYGMLAEPAFFLLVGALALITGHDSFVSVFSAGDAFNMGYYFAALLGAYILFNVMLVENSRIPLDDPRTHLELTMIHEVMVLDFSGIDLAMVQVTSFLKYGIFSSLIAGSIIPPTWPLPLQIATAVGLQGFTGIAVGVLESFKARNRLNKNPQYILTISAIALLVLILALLTLQ